MQSVLKFSTVSPRGLSGLRWSGCLQLLWVVLTGGIRPHAAAFPEFNTSSVQNYVEQIQTELQATFGPSADLDFLHARLANRLGKAGEAEEWAEKALELDPLRADIQLFLTDLLIREDRPKEALAHANAAARIKSDDAGTQRRRGMLLHSLHESTTARAAFARAVRLDPNDSTARVLFGRFLLDEGDLKEATEQLQAACRINPGSANAFYTLAQAQRRNGDDNGARHSLEQFQHLKAVESERLDAKSRSRDDERNTRTLAADSHREWAAFLFRNHRSDSAQAHLEQAVRIAPNDIPSKEMLAEFWMRTRQWEQARPLYAELISLNPGNAVYRSNYGTVLLALHEASAAVDQLRKALDLDPDQSGALNNLARFELSSRRDIAHAWDLARRLVRLEPSADHYDLLAWAAYANGRLDEARAASAKSVELDPNNPVYQQRYRRLKEQP